MKVTKIILLLIILYVLYDLLGPSVGDFFLKRNGVCTKAVITSEILRVRYHRGELKYLLKVEGALYEGNSLEEDKSKVGDSICVIYLKDKPFVNRPEKYFDNEVINCSCR